MSALKRRGREQRSAIALAAVLLSAITSVSVGATPGSDGVAAYQSGFEFGQSAPVANPSAELDYSDFLDDVDRDAVATVVVSISK
jgi:hypothetical protein